MRARLRAGRILGFGGALLLASACNTGRVESHGGAHHVLLKPVPLVNPSDIRLSANLRSHLERLASREMEGRLAGTVGYRRAAEVAAGVFASLGLEPGWKGRDGKPSFFQPVPGVRGGSTCVNVIAVLNGKGTSASARQYVTLAAHLDHLGKTWWGGYYPGVVDDASGCAIVLEAARNLAQTPPKRSVIFVLFTAEESGHTGSSHFVRNPPVPLEQIVMNLNIEQVGSIRSDFPGIFALGPESQRTPFEVAAKRVPDILARHEDIRSHLVPIQESDTWSFVQARQPAVILSSGGFPEHHQRRDDLSRVDFNLLTRACDVIVEYLREVANGA